LFLISVWYSGSADENQCPTNNLTAQPGNFPGATLLNDFSNMIFTGCFNGYAMNLAAMNISG
jgi:hypothetical protein